MKNATQWVLAAALVACGATGNAIAADWGDVTATFVIDGAAPKAKPVVINKDEAVCGKHNLVDESLVVNDGAVQNVVVYLYVARGGKKPPVHDSYKADAMTPVVIDNQNCRFEPHIVAVRTGQPLVAGNKDPVGHNVKLDTLKNPAQNILVPPGGELKINLNAEESLPSPVSCSIHPWMKGFVVVKDHPYVAVSDKEGKITIKNVPAGKWTFQFWQEASGFVQEVKQNGKAVKWDKGRVELTIKPGMNDLGEIKLPPSIFKLN